MNNALVKYKNKQFQFVVENENDYIQSTLLKNKTFYEIELLKSLISFLHKDDIVFDVGANIGNHSIFWAGICSCQVYAFEPYSVAFDLLLKNIELNKLAEKVIANNIALGEYNGKCTVSTIDHNNIGTTEVSLSENGETLITSIDLYMKKYKIEKNISLIKIDVEGFELAVIKGAIRTIRKYQPILVIECKNKINLMEILKCIDDEYLTYDINCATPTYTLINKDKYNDLISGKSNFPVPFYIDKLLNYNQQLAAVNSSYREVNSSIYNLRADKSKLQEQLNIVNAKYREVTVEYKALQSRLDESRLNQDKLIKNLELKTISELNNQNKIKDILDKNEDLEKKLSLQNDNAELYRRSIQELLDIKTKLKINIEDLNSLRKKDQEHLKDLENKLKEVLTNYDNLKSDKVKSQEQLNTVNAKYREVTVEYKALQSRLDESRLNQDKLIKNLELKTISELNNQNKIKDILDKNEDLEKKLSLQNDNAELYRRSIQELLDIKTKLRQVYEEKLLYKSRVDELLSLQNSLNTRVSELINNNKSLENELKIGSLESAYQTNIADSRIAYFKKECDKLSLEKECFVFRINEQKDKINEISLKYRVLTKNADLYKEKIQKLESRVREIQKFSLYRLVKIFKLKKQ